MPALMLLSRNIRRVPMDWQHPTDDNGHVPLFGSRPYAEVAARWDRERAEWDRGEYPSYADEGSRSMPFEEWSGPRPRADNYMPAFPADVALGICMYEEVTEGTPISPVYPDTEQGRSDMATYLATNPQGISNGMTADDWLAVIGGYVVTKDINTGEIEAR